MAEDEVRVMGETSKLTFTEDGTSAMSLRQGLGSGEREKEVEERE